MTDKTTNTLAGLVSLITLTAACGLPASIAQADGPQNTAQSQGVSQSQARKLQIASQALNLLPSDGSVMQAALQNPIQFSAAAGDHEFTGQLIVHAKAKRSTVAQSRVAPSIIKTSHFVPEYVVDVPKGLTEGEMAAMLMATGDYEFVEPNYKLFPLNTPNDSQFGTSWQHTRIQSANAWDIHTGNSSTIVAVCDSGVDTNHPDLEDALIPGFNAVNRIAEVDGGLVEDVNGHGTFVSGCAAAQGNNGTGVVGVGWDFSIMPIRVSNNSSGTANGFDILEGARWAVDHGAHAINASFSGGASSSNQTAAKYIIDRGGLLFWAAGNDNANISFDGPEIVIVASTTSSDTKSSFSNHGTAVDIAAPGSSVRSTRRGGSYGNGSGTSYASPIAAGVGAMIFSVRPDLSGYDVQDILYTSVDDLGPAGRDDNFGRGRVNTFNAMNVAMSYEARLGLPISESFDSASWLDIFESTGGSPSTVADAEATGSVLLLDSSDQVTTVPLAGRSLPPQLPDLSFNFKVAGAEAGESFVIDYQNIDGDWQQLMNYTATGTDTDGYIPVLLTIPVDFLWHGVQLRLTASGSDNSDQFMIDDFMVDLIDATPVAPLVDSFEAGVFTSAVWDDIDGAQIAIDQSTHAASFVGVQSIESIDVPMGQFGIAPGYVRFDAWAGAAAGADDTLFVELRTIGGVWTPIDTIDGTELGTSATGFQYETPLVGWGIDDLRLRLTSAGDDVIYVDNIYVGPDEATGGCSPADFAEPFGELDFFDVSAFLAAFGISDPATDLNNDGNFDFFDVSTYLTIYGQGCP